MVSRSGVALACLASAVAACAEDNTATVDAARLDLARRLDVPLEQVLVAADTDPAVLNEVAAGCVRQGARIDAALGRVQGLVLVVAGQEHIYFASPGEPYRYCELPSTKKRGPPGPPIR